MLDHNEPFPVFSSVVWEIELSLYKGWYYAFSSEESFIGITGLEELQKLQTFLAYASLAWKGLA